MNEGKSEDQWLDALLEKPPELLEQGFVNSVRSQLEGVETLRRRIFLGAALAWTILMLLALPVQFLTESVRSISTLGVQSQRLMQFLSELEIQTLVMQSTNLSTLTVFLLAAYAVISLQVKKW